jgi:hypothetical protein
MRLDLNIHTIILPLKQKGRTALSCSIRPY